MTALGRAVCAGLLFTGVGLCVVDQDEPILNETIKVVYFESMVYPMPARLTHAQGIVVVQVNLDREGRVVASRAISGARMLIADCLSNANKWRFQPNADKRAVIVYMFKIEGLCQMACQSESHVYPPNLVTITVGEPVVDHSGN